MYKKIYTYNDWLKGNVILNFLVFIPKDYPLPTLVGWDSFTEEDVLKIKDKQKKIFNLEVNKKLSDYKKQFLEEFESIKNRNKGDDFILGLPDYYVQNMINWCEEILFDELSYFDTYLYDVKKYVEQTIIRGKNYETIHSKFSKYQDKNIINPTIYAESVYMFWKWLTKKYPNLKNINKI